VCVNAWKFCESECTEGVIIRCGSKIFTKRRNIFFQSHKQRCSNLYRGIEHPDFRVLLNLVNKYRYRIRPYPRWFITQRPVIRRHVVQSGVHKLFFVLCTLFLTARHRSGLIVEGGNTRVKSETRACAVAEDDSFANTVLTAYYICVSEIYFKEVCQIFFICSNMSKISRRTSQYWLHALGEPVVYVYYPDQQIHNLYIYVNNFLYIVSTATCFDASASSSGSLILLLCYSYKVIKLINSVK